MPQTSRIGPRLTRSAREFGPQRGICGQPPAAFQAVHAAHHPVFRKWSGE